jgi:hypothetical protein
MAAATVVVMVAATATTTGAVATAAGAGNQFSNLKTPVAGALLEEVLHRDWTLRDAFNSSRQEGQPYHTAACL